jgi:hypothetical protein
LKESSSQWKVLLKQTKKTANNKKVKEKNEGKMRGREKQRSLDC